MQWKKTQDGYFVVLARGEKIIQSLSQLVEAEQIASGTLTGIGAVMNTRLGFYHLPHKKYDEHLVPEEAELVNLTGNVSWLEKKPVIHIHVTIGLTNFQTMAGHLFEAETAVTAEIFLAAKAIQIMRRYHPEIGLNLQELGG